MRSSPGRLPLASRRRREWRDEMRTFGEYQAAASRVPLSLRNNLDRIKLPSVGLQEEAGKISSLLSAATASGRFNLTPEGRQELRDRLADTLWYAALLCAEAGIPLQDLAAHSAAQLEARAQGLDPDRR